MSAIVRTEVLRALDKAEAHGDKRVRVIVGLRRGGSMEALKRGLGRLGVIHYRRESETFLAVELSRDEILGISQLSEHVSAIRLDHLVSAAQH
jgi:hypothetical protein